MAFESSANPDRLYHHAWPTDDGFDVVHLVTLGEDGRFLIDNQT